MSKTKEIQPGLEAKDAKTDAKPAEAKKPEGKAEQKKAEAPQSKAKGHSALPGHCNAWGCKAMSTRFDFCNEHYDHFKFGLVKRSGEPVPDYEKKFEHYMAYKAKRVQKVA